MAAATKGRLPQGGWVPQLPPHPLPEDRRAEQTPQPQRRRPPLQRMTTTPPLPLQTHQQPHQPPATQPPQDAQEHRPRPPGVPPAPQRQHGQHQRWPRLDYLIVVEGPNDKVAVSAATDSQVFVLRGAAHAADGNTIDVLRHSAFGVRRGRQLRGIMVLMDPDDAGRRGRTMLDSALPGQCWHAFIPAADATATLATRRHDKGNLGVEHAKPDAIQRALASARLAQPERKEFDREDLVALGLVAEMGRAQSQTQGRDGNNSIAPVMRELVGKLLGIGLCDGKQLVKQLNTYGFTHAELVGALRLARGLLADRVRQIRERLRQRQRQQQQQQSTPRSQ